MGLGYARWGWEPVVEPLARSFDVILFDNRGIGESDAPPGPYTTLELAEDAVQVLDEAGVARAHVVGSSLGGMIAQELALARPERVERLVLSGTTPGGPKAFPMPQRTVDLMLARATLREYVENALEPHAAGARRPDRRAPRADGAALRALGGAGAAGAGFDAYDRLGEIAAPTLVQHGDGDVVVDPRNAELLAARIPDVRVSMYPGCGHLHMWQEPERFVRELEEFLC